MLWAKWCEVTFELERNKWAKRLLVVSRFRILILKTGFFGKLGVERNIPILDVEIILEKGLGVLSIESDRTWLLPVPAPGTGALASNALVATGTRSEMGVKTGENVAFLTALRMAYRWFSHGIPESNRLKFNVYKDMLVELPELKAGEKEGASGIVNAYAASCNYLGRRMRESVRRYLLDLSERGIMDICLDDVPSEGGNASSKNGMGYVDMEPIFLALALNDCFESLTSEFVTMDYSAGIGIGGGGGSGSTSAAATAGGGGVATGGATTGVSSNTSSATAGAPSSQGGDSSSSSSHGHGHHHHHHHHHHLNHNAPSQSTITQSSNPSTSSNSAMESLGRCLSRNRRLKRLELVGIGMTESSQIGMGLRMANNFHQLSILNLSKNKLSERTGLALASAFESCTNHSMQSINLNECELSGRALGAIFDAFSLNLFFSLAIQALYLGGNSLNEAATSAILKWSRKAAANGNPGIHLQFLSFAFCYSLSSLDALLGAIASLTPRLRWLDLSGLRMGDQERPAIESFIPTLQQAKRPAPSPIDFNASPNFSDFHAPSPRNLLGLPSYAGLDEDGDLPKIEASPPLLSDYALTLVLRKCNLSNDMVADSLFPALKRASAPNTAGGASLNRVSLDISLNDLTNTCITMFTQLTSDWAPLISLRLCDVKMRPRTFCNFLNSPPPSLLRLDVSGCLSNTNPSPVDLVELNQAFTGYLLSASAKSLLHLNLSNNRPILAGTVITSSPLVGNPNIFTGPLPIPATQSITPSSTSLLASIIYTLGQTGACPLTRLEVEDNGAGDALGHALGRLLRSNTCLSSLRLDGNLLALSGWQAIYAGMTQPPNGNKTLYDCPMPVKDVAKALKSLPASRQPLFLATISHVQSILAANTPKDVLKSTLQASLYATPLEAWPSLAQVSPLPSPASSAAPTPPASTSLNPRVTISVAPTAAATTRRLGMGISSRASVILSPSQLQELGFSPTLPASSQDDDHIRRPRRKSVGPDLAVSAVDFFAAGGGRPTPSTASAAPTFEAATQQQLPSQPPQMPPQPPALAVPTFAPPGLPTDLPPVSPRRSMALPQPPSVGAPPLSPRPLPSIPPSQPPPTSSLTPPPGPQI